MRSSALPDLMDLKGRRVTKNEYFSLLLLTFCNMTAEIVSGTEQDETQMLYGQRDVKVEIVM